MSSKIILYRGRKGCGKTLSMVREGFKYYLNGWKVYRNFYCSFGEKISNDELLTIDEDSQYFNCVIMVDEIQIFFDSRRSMKKENINFSHFVQQIRKRGINLLGTTQYVGTIDLRFRQNCDIVAYPNFLKSFNVCEVTMVDVTAIEDTLISHGLPLPIVKFVFDATPIYDLYNTEEMITR